MGHSGKKNQLFEKFHADQLKSLLSDIEPMAEHHPEGISEDSSPVSSKVFIDYEPPDDASRTLLLSEAAPPAINQNVDISPSNFGDEEGYNKDSHPAEATELVVSHERTELVSTVQPRVTEIDDELRQDPKEGPLSEGDLIKLLNLTEEKVTHLEREIDNLREEKEMLHLVAETQKKQIENLTAQVSEIETKYREQLREAQLEINVLRQNLAEKEKTQRTLEVEIEELKSEIRKNIPKIRMREKHLESRLELLKREKEALIKTKDSNIIQLKQKIEELELALDELRERNRALSLRNDDLSQKILRTVKTLRLSLIHLDSDSEKVDEVLLKKAK